VVAPRRRDGRDAAPPQCLPIRAAATALEPEPLAGAARGGALPPPTTHGPPPAASHGLAHMEGAHTELEGPSPLPPFPASQWVVRERVTPRSSGVVRVLE